MKFTSTVHPIFWFRDRTKEKKLQLSAPFQRKPVWAETQKCYLIESILMDIPIPEIYVQQIIDPDGDEESSVSYNVVDGQQRVRAILQFLGFDQAPDQAEFNRFALDRLDPESKYYGKTFKELNPDDKTHFLNYNFSIKFLHTSSEDAVKEVFKRLNKYLVPLNAQELRNATYSGPFVTLTTKLADVPYWATSGLVSPALIRRMKDVEFVSDLLIGVIYGPQSGNRGTIDKFYLALEDNEDEFPGQVTAQRLFLAALDNIRMLFPDLKIARWGNRTDFYTLFCVFSKLMKSKTLPPEQIIKLRQKLLAFDAEVTARISDEFYVADMDVIKYSAASVRGASDRSRRVERAEVIEVLVTPFLVEAEYRVSEKDLLLDMEQETSDSDEIEDEVPSV